jgi:hypothetical protein
VTASYDFASTTIEIAGLFGPKNARAAFLVAIIDPAR